MANTDEAQGNQALPSNRPTLRLLSFKAVRKATLRGFAAVRLPIGLVITDIPVNQANNGTAWASLPARPMLDRDGNVMRDERDGGIRYGKIIEWGSTELRQAFSERVVALVRAQYPDGLDP
jgi:hypothetical protein